MTLKLSLSALLLAACTALPAAAEIYKWVDASGVTHFSQDPPQGRPFQRIRPDALAAPATASPTPARGKTASDGGGGATGKAEETRQAGLKLKAETLERCAKARERISFLEQRTAYRLYRKLPDGSEARYTQEEFDAELKKARDAESQNCS